MPGFLMEMQLENRRPTFQRCLLLGVAFLRGHAICSARIDVEVLLSHAAMLTRAQLFARLETRVDSATRRRFFALLRRRSRCEPVAYLIGQKEFFGLMFQVNSDVLIPRPDTETLVEKALELIPSSVPTKIVDVCTGSGCVGIAIAHMRPHAAVVGTDICSRAIKLATSNAEELGVADRFEAIQGDLLAPVRHLAGQVNLVVGNPPYIRRHAMSGLPEDVRAYEPEGALVGKEADGLGFHREILDHAIMLLRPSGAVVLEIGHDQADAVRHWMHPAYEAPILASDLAGIPRIVTYRTRQRDLNDA